ncbi:hypothetical protein WJ542_05565 [Paraburkholderia sp. B3]|uniref:hypothetical protein n=1 Tax=Paraburkholderia sp. B3 TaxID=3134791 RepID=UPI0039825D5D
MKNQSDIDSSVIFSNQYLGSRHEKIILWLLAFAPLISLVIRSMLIGLNAGISGIEDDQFDDYMAYSFSHAHYWWVAVICNYGLTLIDYLQLKKHQINTKQFGKLSFIIPVYLWRRCSAFQQSRVIFWVWLGIAIFCELMVRALIQG